MRLALIISSLAMGGAERVLCQLAGAWSAQGVEVTVVTLASASQDFYSLPQGIGRVALDVTGASANPLSALFANVRRLKIIRRTLRDLGADAVVSFLDATNVLSLMAVQGLGIPVVVTEHTDLDLHAAKVNRPWHWLRKIMYPRAAAVVGVSRKIADQLSSLAPGAGRVLAIANPVDPAACQGEPEVRLSGPTVVGMGRLVESKRFDLLIRAFAQCLPSHPDWRLVVLGEGPERAGLERLARELGLEESFMLPGAVRNPGPVLVQAELFALTSRYEGFPMSLVEAMACGLPAVCTDYPAGPGEIIQDGVNGALVPANDPAALFKALDQLMSDDATRLSMGERAREVIQRFGFPAIMERWNELLSKVTDRPWPRIEPCE